MRLLLAFLLVLPLCAQSRRNTPRGEPGVFDLYLLALSWSPQHCSTPAMAERDPLQCGGSRQYGFILHGLWPQYEKSWPQYCETGEKLDKNTIDGMLDIMPSAGLIRHEWAAHGVCNGGNAGAYFATARKAFSGIRIPASFQNPKQARTVPVATIRQEFLAANPGMPAKAVNVQCTGRFLSEVRVCLTRDLKARACTLDVERQACRLGELIIPPLR